MSQPNILVNIKNLILEIRLLINKADELQTQISQTQVSQKQIINFNLNNLRQKNQEIKTKNIELIKLVDAANALNLQPEQKQYISSVNKFVKEVNEFVNGAEKYTNALQKFPEIISKLKELTNYISPVNIQAYTLCQEISALTQQTQQANKNWRTDFQKQCPELLDALKTLLDRCGVYIL